MKRFFNLVLNGFVACSTRFLYQVLSCPICDGLGPGQLSGFTLLSPSFLFSSFIFLFPSLFIIIFPSATFSILTFSGQLFGYDTLFVFKDDLFSYVISLEGVSIGINGAEIWKG